LSRRPGQFVAEAVGHRPARQVAAQERARGRVERAAVDRVAEQREPLGAAAHRQFADPLHRRQVAQPQLAAFADQQVAGVQVAGLQAAVVHVADQDSGRVGAGVVARERERNRRDAAGDDEAARLAALVGVAVRQRLDRRQRGVAGLQQVVRLALPLALAAQPVARPGRDRVGAEHLDVHRRVAEPAPEHAAHGALLDAGQAMLLPSGDVVAQQFCQRFGDLGRRAEVGAASGGRGMRQSLVARRRALRNHGTERCGGCTDTT
jgi:hypothetical protein